MITKISVAVKKFLIERFSDESAFDNLCRESGIKYDSPENFEVRITGFLKKASSSYPDYVLRIYNACMTLRPRYRGEIDRLFEVTSKKHWKTYATALIIVAGIIIVIGILTGFPFHPASDTVTVLVHGENGKNDLILPSRGIVKLIYGDAIISEQINNEGEATFKQVPGYFFKQGIKVEILFRDPLGEPYRAIEDNKLYQLKKGQYISLPVKLFGLESIRGIVKDFLTGEYLSGVRISVQGSEAYSDEYGEFTLDIPPDKQKQFQTIRAFKAGYEPFEINNIPVQTGREISILMKPGGSE